MWKPTIRRDHIRLRVQIYGSENIVLVSLGFPSDGQVHLGAPFTLSQLKAEDSRLGLHGIKQASPG